METKIIEGNKLIAEFMGYIDNGDPDGFLIDPDTNYDVNVDELKYHYSWDWLMPVVGKITQDETLIGNEYRESIMDVIPYGIIEDTFNCVVEFIKWYNNERKGNN